MTFAARIALIAVLAAGAVTAAASPAAAMVQQQVTGPDSLIRAGQQALDRNDYRTAATLFGQAATRSPSSSKSAATALYFQAFALRRLGTDAAFRQALAALQTLRERFPKHANVGDIGSLEVSIQGELARRGDSAAAEAVTKIAERQTTPGDQHDERCPEESQERIVALGHLQKMDASRAAALLQELLANRSDRTVCLRRLAIFVLAQQKNIEGAEGLLLGIAGGDPDPRVRGQAVLWLSAVNSPQAVNALEMILRNTTDSDLRAKALFALGEHNTNAAQQALQAYAERGDVSDDVRTHAIRALGRFPSPERSNYLQGLYDRVPTDRLKLQIITTLGESRLPRNGRWLLGIVRNSSNSKVVRRQAIWHAGQAGAPLADLIALYGPVEPELREGLVYVYAQREDPAALEKLIEIAKHDPAQPLREMALFWLQRSKQPRAAVAVKEINRGR